MSAAKLVKPSVDLKETFLEALAEFQTEGRYTFLNIREVERNFEDFIFKLNNGKKGLQKPYAEWIEPVPETVLWLVKDNVFLGTLNIRHRLNWHLEKWGGHINFAIRPSYRGKGFGKKILQKGVDYVNFMGIKRALLTTDPANAAVIRVVEFCGGTLEDELPQTDKFPARRRYWLNCA